jgi:hypothetical protein
MNKSQWKISDNFIGMLVIAFVLALLAAAILPSLATSGKLHGNEYALNNCKWEMRIWKSGETNSSSFDFSKLSHEDTRRVLMLAWKLDVQAKTNFLWQADKTKREIVIVCGTEFDNVPKSSWSFFLKYPAHAVGYSDGTAGLISPEQFTNLDLTGFVSLSNLATNSEFNIFKQ